MVKNMIFIRRHFLSWSKKVAVSYHFIDCAYDDYYTETKLAFNSLLNSEDSSGTFDAGESHYYWKIERKVDITESDTFFISLFKEKESWPVYLNEEEGISEVPISEGSLGELYYCIFNPDARFILTLAAAGGAPVGAFKKFLNEFSKDGSVKLTPLFEDKIDIKTLSWDFYKKLAITVNFPSHDIQSEFITTKEGSLLKMIDELGGLKADITISAPKQKQNLNNSQVKEIAKSLLTYDFCTKLTLRGADNDGEAIEEFDLKNAQVKYKETIEISGSYMSIDEALPILKRAFNDRSSDLMHLSE